MYLWGRLATRSERSEASKIDKIDKCKHFIGRIRIRRHPAAPGRLEGQPGSSRVVMERDAWSQGGGGGHVVPMGDSRCALLARIGCVVERLGAGAAIPNGGTASSTSVAAPAWRHVRPTGKYDALVRRRTQRCALGRAVIGTIRAAASNDSHGAQRHRVYLVGHGASHIGVGASRQSRWTHGPDPTREGDARGRDAPPRSIRARTAHCPRAVTIATWTSSESDLPGPFPTREGSGKEHSRQFGGGKATMLARLDGVAVWCRPPSPGRPRSAFAGDPLRPAL